MTKQHPAVAYRKAKEFTNWKEIETVSFSIESAREGGLGLYAITLLHSVGIPARRDPAGTPYQGHVAIQVPKRFERKAERLVL